MPVVAHNKSPNRRARWGSDMCGAHAKAWIQEAGVYVEERKSRVGGQRDASEHGSRTCESKQRGGRLKEETHRCYSGWKANTPG